MNRKIFNDGIAELLISFPKMTMNRKRADIWYKYSKHITDDKWQEKIKNCVSNCFKYEPMLADILDKNNNYIERNNELTPKTI